MENGYSEEPLNRAPIKSTNLLLEQVWNIPEKVKIIFSINTKEIYKMIVDLQISLKLLHNFSKQASSVVAANFYESYSTSHFFANFRLLGYISEITTPMCDIDAITLISAVFHDAIFTKSTS